MTYAFYGGNQVSDLFIDNCKCFGLTPAKLGIIASHCKQLKHLKLRGGGATPVTLDGLSNIQFPILETLYLGLGVRVSDRLLSRILHTSPNLQKLSVFDLAAQGQYVISRWPVLKKLETVQLANGGTEAVLDMVSSIIRAVSRSDMPLN